MGTLKEDIKTQSDWIVKAFDADGMSLDYSVSSLLEVDRFFQKHIKDGRPIKGGRLSKNLGGIIFSISSYVGETIIKNVPDAEWVTNDDDPNGEINIEVMLGNGTRCWPGQRVIKRIQNGLEDGIYPYVHHITKEFTNEESDGSFWNIEKEVKSFEIKKPWWKF